MATKRLPPPRDSTALANSIGDIRTGQTIDSVSRGFARAGNVGACGGRIPPVVLGVTLGSVARRKNILNQWQGTRDPLGFRQPHRCSRASF